MATSNVSRIGGDSEKITINLNFVDLGSIDLLVRESVYTNRTDFIRTAIRNQLDRHRDVSEQVKAREAPSLGIVHLTREELEKARAAGTMFDLTVLGLASIAEDVTSDLALATIRSIKVLGAFHASAAVKAALADRLA